MSVPVALPFILALSLIVLGTVPGGGIHIALPLSALMVATAIWSHRPLTTAWRWAGWGSLFWATEEVVWALARAVFERTFIYLTDPLYFAGLACWFVAVIKMNQRAIPKFSLLVTLPALLFVGWLLLQNPHAALFTAFPLFDLALLLVAIPAIEKSFYGDLPEGRLLWLLGLFGRALAGSLYVWLDIYPYTLQLLSLLWLFSYTFIALGAWIELRGHSGGLWPVAYGLFGLEAVTGIVLAVTFIALADRPLMILVAGLFLGYLLFIGMLLLVIADRNRRVRAERELKRWSALLEALAALPPVKDHQTALGGILSTLQRAFPELVGLSATAGKTFYCGATTPYAFPLVAEGAEIGRLFFSTEPLNTTVLDAASPAVAAHLERALSQLHWYTQALVDPLTGLHNRRIFELRATTLTKLATRQAQPLSLAFLDIDHFKRINDEHGHPIGDEVLKAVAGLLDHHTREEDLAVRWGGEEFVLLLYGSNLARAHDVIERIRFELRQQQVASIDWPITLSAGLVGGTVPSSENTLYRWLFEADRALLKAKASGRDQLVIVAPVDEV